jgi:hypothetical protein
MFVLRWSVCLSGNKMDALKNGTTRKQLFYFLQQTTFSDTKTSKSNIGGKKGAKTRELIQIGEKNSDRRQ